MGLVVIVSDQARGPDHPQRRQNLNLLVWV